MFVSDKLIYLQMEKTASTHIAKAISEVVGGEPHVQHIHLTRDAIGGRLPIDVSGRLVVASIRNPWSWYLSLWAYGCRGGGGRYGTLHRLTASPPTMSDLVRRSFVYARAKRKLPVEVIRDVRDDRAHQKNVRTDLWRPLFQDANDVDAFREWLRLFFAPERAHEIFPEYGRSPLRNDGGFMTFRYFWNFARDRGLLLEPGHVDDHEQIREFDRDQSMLDDMIVLEHLASDLPRVLERAGYELSAEQIAQLERLAGTKTNESPHKRDCEYFDDETLDLVARRDWFLIERFGLEPPT